jgi:hypothetical protein
MDNLPGTIRLSTERMIVMGQNLRIKLTKLIEKLPEAVISSLLEQAESYQDAQTKAGRPACPYCGNTHIVKYNFPNQ